MQMFSRSLCILALLAMMGVPTFAQSSGPAAQGVATQAKAKTFIDYFLPTPPHGPLARDAWGAPNVLPRDNHNGLEDTTIKNYCYWDGQIIKAPDGKYHMFASRWNESRGHNGWFGSVAVHAVSDSLTGPYIDKGLCWPNDQGGRGHNVTALTLPDGRYAIVISETRPCEVYVSKSLDGPWEHLGTIKVEGEPRWHGSNVSLMARPDGNFEFTQREGRIYFSDKGILGPYKVQGPSVFPQGIPNLEDPCIWYSGGLYHILVNSWSNREAYHLTSPDGIHNWTNRGVAYDPRKAVVRYPDGTVNHWNKLERPSVFIENGHVVALTFAAIDVEKDQERGRDGHGSKVIVIPFDGAALERDLQKQQTPISIPSAKEIGPKPAKSAAAATSATAPLAFHSFAPTPPMGWNSYDAFGDSVTEAEVLANAAYVKEKLLPHGWNYIVVDFRWYDPEPTGNDFILNQRRTGAKLAADPFGRMVPAENRFPSSAGGKGFKPLADKLHAMGLKFGFHYMRGIPRQAVLAKTPIADSSFTAADAGDPQNTCGWCPDMFGVRNTAAGQAWYDAMFKLYASWGLDFIKVDDLSNPYRQSEIEMIRRAIDKCGRPIVLSTSAGPTDNRKADHVRSHANMWRISGDFWDRWQKLNAQFDLMNSWRGVAGPGHFPDADMLPLGHLCIRSKAGGNDHVSRYTRDEQLTLMSFWCLAPSPLMLGGNLPDNTDWDLALITNDEVLALDQDSSVKPAARVSQQGEPSTRTEVWVRELKDGSRAVGLFNRGGQAAEVTLDWAAAGLSGKWTARDLWQHKDLGAFNGKLALPVPPHGAVLLKLTTGAAS